MSTKNKNNNKITIANVIALAALAGLGVVSFFGALLHSPDGSPGGPLMGAICIVLGLAFLLFLGIYAKGAESNAEKWRFVEWGCLALYIVVALLTAKPFLRFFYVNSQKTELKNQATSELQAIQNIYKNYNKQCEQSMTLAKEQIANYMLSGYKGANDSLKQYVLQRVFGGKEVDKDKQLNSWYDKGLQAVKKEDNSQLDSLNTLISNWSIMQLNNIAQQLALQDTTVLATLNKKIESCNNNQELIPNITGSKTEPYKLDGFVKFDLGQSPQPKFAEMLSKADGNTIGGWVIYAILHLLVLFNLLVAPRSKDVNPIKGNRNTGGLEL